MATSDSPTPAAMADLCGQLSRDARTTADRLAELQARYRLDADVDAAVVAHLADESEHWRDYLAMMARQYERGRRRGARRAVVYAVLRLLG